MGSATYYSPLWLGMLLVLIMNEMIRGLVPAWSVQMQWLVVAGVALAVGAQCQVFMFGLQGAFAQVVPVPWGRSLRGRPAALTGTLLMAWVLLSGVTVLLGFEEVSKAAWTLGVTSLVVLALAAIVYVWGLPAALEDFREPRRR